MENEAATEAVLCGDTFKRVCETIKARSRTVRHIGGIPETPVSIDPDSEYVAAFKVAAPYEQGDFYGLGTRDGDKVTWLATGRTFKDPETKQPSIKLKVAEGQTEAGVAVAVNAFRFG